MCLQIIMCFEIFSVHPVAVCCSVLQSLVNERDCLFLLVRILCVLIIIASSQNYRVSEDR